MSRHQFVILDIVILDIHIDIDHHRHRPDIVHHRRLAGVLVGRNEFAGNPPAVHSGLNRKAHDHDANDSDTGDSRAARRHPSFDVDRHHDDDHDNNHHHHHHHPHNNNNDDHHDDNRGAHYDDASAADVEPGDHHVRGSSTDHWRAVGDRGVLRRRLPVRRSAIRRHRTERFAVTCSPSHRRIVAVVPD